MTFHTDAVYEGGVLRPLTPLDLKEREVVSLWVSAPRDQGVPGDQPARQRRILMDYVAKVESRPDTSPQDGLSNRDHDRIIYGT